MAKKNSTRSRQLTSDQLGEMAQTQFSADCIPGGLIPNKSNYDRTGWDYIVEWPQDVSVATLDKRPTPISCHVQIKATWLGNDKIRLRLSSAERLAKELKPAFIYVFAVDNHLKYDHARVIHMQGDFLALILKKLRETQAAVKQENKVHFDINVPRWGTQIEVGGQAFRKFVEDAVAGSMVDYASRKQKDLKTLGYGAARFKMPITFIASREELADAFLGLRRIEAEITDPVEERFGIALPMPEFNLDLGMVEFKPNPSDACELRLRKSRNSPWISFKGHIYRLPGPLFDPQNMKMAIKTDLLIFILRGEKKGIAEGSFNFSILPREEILEKTRFETRELKNLYEFYASLCEGPLMMELVSRKSQIPPIRGTINLNGSGDDDGRRWRRVAALVGKLEKVLHLAGTPSMKVSNREVLDAAGDIEAAAALIENPIIMAALSFRTEAPKGLMDGFSTPMLYFRTFELGSYSFAVCAKLNAVMSIENKDAIWRGTEIEFISTERIKSTYGLNGEVLTDLEAFIYLMRNETGIETHVLADSPRMQRLAENNSTMTPEA